MARQNQLNLADGVPLWGLIEGIDRSVPSPRIGELGLSEAFNVISVDGVMFPRPGANVSRFPAPDLLNNSVPAQFFVHRDRATQVDIPLACAWRSSGTNLFIYKYDGVSDWDLLGLNFSSTSYDKPPQLSQFADVTILLPGGNDGTRAAVWIPSTGDFQSIDTDQPDSDLRAPRGCRYIASSGSRVFMADGYVPGDTERIAHRIWWSDSGRFDVWGHGSGKPGCGSASYEDTQQDTFEITGMHMHSGQRLFVFKAWGIWVAEWRGEPSWYQFPRLSSKIGTVACKTIQQWRDQLLFLGTDHNVYRMGLDGQPIPVGNKIQRYIASIINQTHANRACAAVDPIKNLYYLWIPIGSELFNRHLLVLNLDYLVKGVESWTEGLLHTDCPITSAYSYYPGYSTTPGIFLSQFANNGEFREFDFDYNEGGIGDEDGEFEAHIWSKTYDFAEYFKGASETGEIHKIALQGQSGKAIPRTRVGDNLYQLATASTDNERLEEYGEIDIEADDDTRNHYTSGRSNAYRFGQWGVKWEEGSTDPMPLEGVMVWGRDRSEER